MNTHNKSGSALVAVMVITVALALVVAGTLSHMTVQTRLNHSNRLYNEARVVAETALENGMAQVSRIFNQNVSLVRDAFDPLDPLGAPLRLNTEFLSFFSNNDRSRAVVPTVFDPLQAYTYPTTLIAGMLSEQYTWTIDPNQPANQGNPLAGTTVRTITVNLYAKGTARDDRWGDRSAYLRQTFYVVDQSLYQYAVFYSSADLELAPGANFNAGALGVPGPIHSNYDVYFGTSATLNVNVPLTAAGDFFARRHSNSGQGGQSGTIKMFNPQSLSLVDLGSGGNYLDSEDANFRELAHDKFRGGLMTQEHGVQKRYPVGIEELNRLSTSSASAQNNWEYHLITPPNNLDAIRNDTALTSEQKSSLLAVEEIKFSNRSGLTVEMDASGSLRYFTHELDAKGNPVYDSSGNLKRIELEYTETSNLIAQTETFSSTTEDKTATVNSGLFDYRMAEGSDTKDSGKINLLRVNVGNLRSALEDSTQMAKWRRRDNNTAYAPNNWWNGGLYVNMPRTATTTTARTGSSPPMPVGRCSCTTARPCPTRSTPVTNRSMA